MVDIGRVARLPAGSRPDGLLLGVETPERNFSIADGMVITSQLVGVINDPNVRVVLKQHLGDDMRISSVHAQHPVEFLGDVRDHRFDFITVGELAPLAVRLAATSLAPEGLLVSPGVDGSLIAAGAPDCLQVGCHGQR